MYAANPLVGEIGSDPSDVVASLRAHAEKIRAAQLAKLGRLSGNERRTLELVTAQMLNRFLDLPAVCLAQAASSAERATYADAVRHLFGLGEDE